MDCSPHGIHTVAYCYYTNKWKADTRLGHFQKRQLFIEVGIEYNCQAKWCTHTTTVYESIATHITNTTRLMRYSIVITLKLTVVEIHPQHSNKHQQKAANPEEAI